MPAPQNQAVVTNQTPDAPMKNLGFGFQVPDGWSVMRFPLYSRVPLAAGVAHTEVSTFIGTGVSGTIPRSDVDSNVTQARQLPQNWYYSAHSMSVKFVPTAIATSIDTDYLGFANGIATLIIQNAKVCQMPIFSCGGMGGWSGIGQGVTGSGGTALLQNGNASVDDVYRFPWEYGLSWPIDGGAMFDVQLKWGIGGAGGTTTPYTPVNTVYAWVILDGFLAAPPDSI